MTSLGVALSKQVSRRQESQSVLSDPMGNALSDGVTLIPWEGGMCLAWDATVIDTLEESYRARSAEAAGAAAEIAAERKSAK